MKILTVALFLITLNTSAQKLETRQLYVDVFYDNPTDPSFYCGEETVNYMIRKNHVIVSSSKFEIDVKIVKRNVGEYHSVIGRTPDDRYYFISGIAVDGGIGLLFQPIEIHKRTVEKITYLPNIAISAKNLCK